MTTRAPGRPELHQPTGDTRIDAALRSVVGAYEERFPGRARSYYLFGSYAVGTATVNSDIDVYVIFRAEFLDGERERVAALASECERDSPAPLELIVRAEGDDFFFAFCTEPLKTASRLLFGEDIRDRVAPPDIDTFVAVGLSSDPLLRLGETRGRPDVLRYPLEHPDSSAPFQGYTPARAGPKLRHPLQRLYLEMRALATGLICRRARIYPSWPSSETPSVYAACVGDEWTCFLKTAMDSIGNHWGYAMPVDAAATRSLEQICGELVGFENRFLDEYLDHAREVLAGPPSAEGPWLTAELAEHMTGLDTARLAQRAAAGELAVNVTDGRERFRLPDFAQLYALQQLRRVVYPPELVMPTLERAIATGGTEVAEAARDTALWVRYCAAAADTGLGTGASQSPQRSRQ